MEKKTYLPLAKALAERRNTAATGLGCYSSTATIMNVKSFLQIK